MTIALVQETDAASSSLTLGASATAGNTVVVAVACLASPTAGVTGVTLGATPDNFTLLAPGPSAQDDNPPGDVINVSVWADANCAGGSAAIAITGTGVVAAWAWEFSGLAGGADLARVFPVTSYQASWLSSLPQTTVPAEAWIAITCAANQTATETLTVAGGAGWTAQTAYNGTLASYFWGAQAAYQTVNDVAAPAWNGSFSQPSFSVTALVTLPMAATAAPAPPVPLAAPIAPGVTVSSTGTLSAAGAINAGSPVTQASAGVQMIPVGPKTGNYTAKPGDFVLVDTSRTTALVTITFPAGAPAGSLVGVKLINAGTAALTVQAAGSDVFDALPGGTSSLQMTAVGAAFIAQYRAANTTWYIQSAGYTEPRANINLANSALLPGAPPASTPLPGDLSLATWSYDAAYLASPFSGTALTSGKIYLVMCPVRTTTVLAGGTIYAWITSAGSGLTAGQNFTGVYSATGTLLGVSGDSTGTFGSTGIYLGGPGAPFTVTPPFVWAAFLSNGTTPPSFARTSNQSANWANINTPTTFPRFGTLSGTYTSLPSTFGVAVPGLAAAMYWAALS